MGEAKEDVLAVLTGRVGRLHRLLAEPEPGLFTWKEALLRQVNDLVDWWREGDAKAEAKVRTALVDACEKALAYDLVIQGYAKTGQVAVRGDGSGNANGDDLDAAYSAWVDAARAALALAGKP